MTADFEPISVDLAREPDFSVGALSVRPSLRQIESEAGSETLEPRVMQVLVALAQRRGEVVSRDELIRRCWGGRVVGEDAISRAIARVRKLGEASHAFTLETIPRVGYRLVAASGAGVVHARETRPAPGADAGPTRKFGSPKQLAVLVAGAVIAVLAIAAVYLGIRNSRQVEVAGPPQIAVLPFDILSGSDAEVVTVARTAPAAITDNLLKAGQKVMSLSASQAQPGQDLRATLLKAGVSHFVEGYAARRDGHVVLTTRIASADGVAIWTCPLEATGAKGSLEAQAAAAVTYAFRWLSEVPAARSGSAEAMTSSLRLAGCSGDGMSALAGYEDAKKAALASPNIPFLQIGQIVNGSNAFPQLNLEDRKRVLGEMREAQKRAKAQRPDLSTLHLADSMLMPEADWAGREAALRAGMDAQPRTGLISGNFSDFLTMVGRHREAEDYARKHMAMEPTSPIAPGYLASALVMQGRFADATAVTAKMIELFPDHTAVLQIRFATLLLSGDIAGAEAMLANPSVQDVVDPPAAVRPVRAFIAALKAKDARSEAALETACADTSRLSDSGAGLCLTALAMLGRTDKAFALLDRLLPDLRGATPAEMEARWIEHPLVIQNYAPLLMLPSAAGLREDKRFIDVAERIGLAGFWRSSGKWPDFCESEPKSVCAELKKR